ncbi:Medium-chain acyl-CoA ligase ACSF2, mitochondrial [Halotydeus destructor]|nr:Medium-chain acyl-CoA ligase ACSF2, mitochondrial [Halotydeus destructor]
MTCDSNSSADLAIYHSASQLPLIRHNIGQQLDLVAADQPDTVAIVCPHESLSKTFQDFNQDVTQCANAMRVKLNLKLGDNIALISGSCYDFIVTKFAAARAGLVAWLINPRSAPCELEHFLDLCRPKAIFLPSPLSQHGAKFDLGTKLPLEVHPSAVRVHFDPSAGNRSLRSLMTGCSVTELQFRDLPTSDDGVLGIFTSGSTGKPKAVLVSHFMCLNTSNMFRHKLACPQGQRYAIPVPLFLAYGSSMLFTLTTGATVVIPFYHYSGTNLVRAIDEYQCTHAALVFSLLSDLIFGDRGHDLTRMASVTTIVTAGMALPEGVTATVKAKLPQLQSLHNLYGTSETSAVAMNSTGTAAIGRPVDHVTAKVVDENGNTVQIGQHGVLMVKTPFRMVGYVKEDASLSPPSLDYDGFYNTQDIVKMNDKHELLFVGRSTEMINRGGEKFAPIEVEKVLECHAKVQKSFACGLADHRLGQEVYAYVQVSPDSDLTEDELLEFARTKLPHHKVPRRISLTGGEVPLNSFGKVDKMALRTKLLRWLARTLPSRK